MKRSTNAQSIRIRMLASGSNGNSILVSSSDVNLLVDGGLSCRELKRRLALVGHTPADITAAIVTHEHQDHVRGIGVLSRQYGIPIYMNARTLKAARATTGEVPTARLFSTGDVLEMGSLTIQTYPVPHDAVDPIGLSVDNCSSRVGIALDMGYATKLVKQRLRNSSVLILEFNHDPEMLRQCTRPWELKQRILSKRGHMSNGAAVELLCDLVHDSLRAVVLAHISREANSTHLAYRMVSERLREIGRRNISVVVSTQEEVAEAVET